jgi:hypothetical protein
MTIWRDFDDEMKRLPLDADTADRLLAGAVSPEDAPPGYAGLASLLRADRMHDTLLNEARERDTVASLVTAVRSSQTNPTRSPRRSSVHRLKLFAAIAAATFACTAGLAVAGDLPGAAQDIASSMLAKVGIVVPGPNDSAGDHPSTRGKSAGHQSVSQEVAEHIRAQSRPDAASSGKGAEISELATTTDLQGVEKGAAISTLASGGQSQAGQHGSATADHGSASAHDGAETADAASSGHSTARGDNAATGQSHRP